jgi:maltose/maltodextrin transport system permease protein
VKTGLPWQKILVVLAALPALFVDWAIYWAGNIWLALVLLAVICLAIYVYISNRAYFLRYLFPGLVGFSLFVIFPLVYTVYISFTKYSSQNLLTFSRALALVQQETFAPSDVSYSYRLFRQNDGRYLLYLENTKDSGQRFVSDPLPLAPGREDNNALPPPYPLRVLGPGETVPGKALDVPQITREGLIFPLRKLRLASPSGEILQKEGLVRFAPQQALWASNPDGTLTNQKDGTRIRPDFSIGRFVDDKGQPVELGFRTFTGFSNYVQIFTDPRLQAPFLRIFVWTVAFSAFSVFLSFAVGILVAVILEWKELRHRKLYRTMLILPYAVPAILSILIFKGLFNQQFGAVNEVLKGIFGFAPAWESNPWAARLMILIVNVWLSYPYMMLIATGMLQAIPGTLYEASTMDGSNPITDFFHITLPLVVPPLLPILISSFAFNFNNFNLVYLLTAGGPKMVGGGIAGETDLLVTYTFNLAFRDSGTNYGLASAIATLLFLIIGVLAWMNLKISGRRVIT